MQTNGNQKGTSSKGGSKSKIIIFVIEIIIILIMIAVLYLVMKPAGKGSEAGNGNGGNGLLGENIGPGSGPKVTELETDKLEIPEEVKENETMKGYMNIALFGVDAESTKIEQLYKGYRSDTIMIASINMDTGDIRLVSVYRDTFMNIGTDEYHKCNKAYSVGGPEQAVKMLNMNLDMDIENFVTVSYAGLKTVIDGLGGIYIDVSEEELQHINNYQIGISEILKCTYTPVEHSGYQKLNGLQAAAFCRIRYISGGGDEGNDFKRASNQREVLKAIEEQAKKTDLVTLTKVFNDAIGYIFTSLDSKDILELLAHIADYRIVEEGGFPQADMRTVGNIGAKGSSVIPVSLESNVVWLHQFLFDDMDYVVTDSVKKYGAKIKEQTDPYLNR